VFRTIQIIYLSFTGVKNTSGRMLSCMKAWDFMCWRVSISGKSTPVSGWLNSTLANCWQKAWQIPSYLQLPLSFWRKTAEILFYLSLLAAVFQRECQEFIERNSVYVWISFPWLVCQYPRLLIFWTGCVAHLFSQALARRHNGDHI